MERCVLHVLRSTRGGGLDEKSVFCNGKLSRETVKVQILVSVRSYPNLFVRRIRTSSIYCIEHLISVASAGVPVLG